MPSWLCDTDRSGCLSVDAVETVLPCPVAGRATDPILAPGHFGPLREGAMPGLFCLGCYWLLMVLLFVGGLMNLLWIAALALRVLIEKLLPVGPRVSRLTGIALKSFDSR